MSLSQIHKKFVSRQDKPEHFQGRGRIDQLGTGRSGADRSAGTTFLVETYQCLVQQSYLSDTVDKAKKRPSLFCRRNDIMQIIVIRFLMGKLIFNLESGRSAG